MESESLEAPSKSLQGNGGHSSESAFSRGEQRILFVQDYLRGGGTEHQCIALARYALTQGFFVRLLTFRPGGRLEPLLVQSEPVIHRLSLQSRDWRLNWWAPGIGRAVSMIQPTAVVLMGRNANCYGWFLKRAAGERSRLIATLRGARPLPWLYRRTLRVADLVLTNSAFAADRAAQGGAPPERTRVIHNGLRLQPSSVEPVETLRRHFGLPVDRPVMLCLGRVREAKGQLFLLRVLASLPAQDRPILWVVGEGDGVGALFRESRRLGLRDDLVVTPYQKDPVPVFRAGDFFALASTEESLPNALIEAQACGLPVIALDHAGVGECFLPDQSGVLLPGRDVADWAVRVRSLATDEDLRRRMGETAAGWAGKKFAFADRAEDFLRAVLNR